VILPKRRFAGIGFAPVSREIEAGSGRKIEIQGRIKAQKFWWGSRAVKGIRL
jgi:hypothetical protein